MLAMAGEGSTSRRRGDIEVRRLKRLEGIIETLPLAPNAGYAEIVETMIARRRAIGISQLEVDARAGLAEGHTGRLENWRSKNGRCAGPRTMRRWIAALWPSNDALADE